MDELSPTPVPRFSNATLVLAAIFCFALVAILSVSAYAVLEQKKAERASTLAALSSSTEKIVVHSESFADLSLGARAVYVLDLSTGAILYQKNANVQLPLASLTKLMTALVASDLISSDTSVMFDGQQWDRDVLINLTLVVSSNEGADALALAGEKVSEKKFLDEMNFQARSLGMSETFYVNPTGLDLTGTQGGSYGSAHDMAQLMAFIVTHNPELIQATRFPLYMTRSLEGVLITVRNTNPEVSRIPGILGSKTGFTDLANGNLIIAFDRGLAQPVVIAVLGSSQEGRFRDVETLVERTFAYYHQPLTTP